MTTGVIGPDSRYRSPSERSFDRYVIVDWSAASRPTTGANSIWIANRDASQTVELTNHATRVAAEEALGAIFDAHREDRILVGIDVSLGLPGGSLERFALEAHWSQWWRHLAEAIIDGPDNRNNRWEVAAALNRRSGADEGPFWGHPVSVDIADLGPRRPPAAGFADFRHCEDVLRRTGQRPFPIWQLAYRGSVGSQSLTAIPVLERLRRRHRSMRIWPFEVLQVGPDHIASAASARIVVAEVWPSLWSVDRTAHHILDAAQVINTATRLAAADADGSLRGWLEPAIDGPRRELVVTEEGWILGAATVS